jgi:hypothetical protein
MTTNPSGGSSARPSQKIPSACASIHGGRAIKRLESARKRIHHFTQFLHPRQRFFASRYRNDTDWLSRFSLLLIGNDVRLGHHVKRKPMRTGDKLKSTTVRFTDADLLVINRLREKLGPGMIQIIRLAIRRLGEIENVLPPSSARKKD